MMVLNRTKYKNKILRKVRVVGSEYEWKDGPLIRKDIYSISKRGNTERIWAQRLRGV